MGELRNGLYINKIPDSWWATDEDDPSSVISIGEKRLMLPKDTPSWWEQLCAGYVIDSKRRWVQKVGQTEHQSVEQTVIFDNIYPRCYLRVKNVTEKRESQNEEYTDGSIKRWQWTRYIFEVEQYPSGNAFDFSMSFVSDELKVYFCSEMEEVEACNQSGTAWVDAMNKRLLAGMTFKVGFDIVPVEENGTATYHQRYEIVRNEDYGAMLPNDILKPTDGDVLILIGWDAKSMGMTGIIETAEDTLAYCAAEYLKAMEEGQFVFRLGMMSDWPFELVQGSYQEVATITAVRNTGRIVSGKWYTSQTNRYGSNIDISDYAGMTIELTPAEGTTMQYALITNKYASATASSHPDVGFCEGFTEVVSSDEQALVTIPDLEEVYVFVYMRGGTTTDISPSMRILQWVIPDKEDNIRNGHYALPDAGQRISVPIGAQGVKTSRLIGYELKLDYPYDSAELEVGETDAYSRLKRIEREISKQR